METTDDGPTTRWVEDPSMPAPDGHLWVRPAPDDCPNCDCCSARLCEAGSSSLLGCIGKTSESDPETRKRISVCPCANAPGTPNARVRETFAALDRGEIDEAEQQRRAKEILNEEFPNARGEA